MADELPSNFAGYIEGWVASMNSKASEGGQDDPAYYSHNPRNVVTSSYLHSFQTGTGDDIFTDILPRVEHAETEVLTLGLPSPEELSGLDLEIKSVFVRPFSVMHPKFVCVDRKMVWLPSCNVSWETWFEGCLALSGPAVEHFVDFWYRFWGSHERKLALQAVVPDAYDSAVDLLRLLRAHSSLPESFSSLTSAAGQAVPSVFLPSLHHVNPRFRPFPWQAAPPPPPTPLNTFILHSLETAKYSIYIQTPNLTCAPVLTAILAALRRGVDVHIVTSERLMRLEQLGTAGTTTSRCMKKLIKRYKKLPFITHIPIANVRDEHPQRGRLHIEYYRPRKGASDGEPVQSHLKLTIIDEECVVLGSGNMDRASWYTSQELGVAFYSTELAAEINTVITNSLKDRLKLVFPEAQHSRSFFFMLSESFRRSYRSLGGGDTPSIV
ncbi:phospholipase D/nuclease [Saccharata proteae CBS 121410]|uniref:Phospholipase D/nuclease n=1 Tax=Saccharata proteae CBS 121410 TaxID=1314787 RepID=A0A9P4I322_9PEZI|nr:phospholipase D/nuclease [Saccharata proteae CBS 121410]